MYDGTGIIVQLKLTAIDNNIRYIAHIYRKGFLNSVQTIKF